MDVTPQWRASHAHLQPLDDMLELATGQRRACSLCGGQRAFGVVADACFGYERWSARAQFAYCPDCRGYSMDFQHAAAARIDAGVGPDEALTRVNARLWSATPTFLNLEPTTRCNFACWYCVGRHMEQADIDAAGFSRLLDNFPDLRALALVGEGEPLMHKEFFAMARMARDRGVRVLAISNGSTFSTANVKKICEAEIAYISISIDSWDAATFAASRIGGELDKVLAGIRRLADYRDKNGYRYPRIGLKGTLFAATESQMPRIAELAKASGVDIFESFQPLNPMSTYVPIYPREKLPELQSLQHVAAAIRRDGAQALATLKSVAKFADEEGLAIDKNGYPNGLRPNCDEEWIYALLSGDVTPCCQIKNPVGNDWNLFRRSMEEILAARDYENVRFNLWNGLFPTYCRGCWKTRG